MLKKANENIPKNYYCNTCYYGCSKKSSWSQHINTAKHIKANKELIMAKTEYTCIYCENNFRHHSSLCRHIKKCKKNINGINNNILDSIDITDKDALIMYVLKQNGELQKSLIEMSKENGELHKSLIEISKDKSVTNNKTNCHNTTNNAFNLNFFLNETCKNALNIHEFVSSIKISLDDLENTGRQGYIDGISNIILKNLNKLNHYDRPIHCSDQKREILYIKNDNQWFKESEEKPILTKAIKTIANENIKQIQTWKQKNPDCTDSESKNNNLYLKIVSNSMSGSDKEECDKNLNKIINNIAKETIIPKE